MAARQDPDMVAEAARKTSPLRLAASAVADRSRRLALRLVFWAVQGVGCCGRRVGEGVGLWRFRSYRNPWIFGVVAGEVSVAAGIGVVVAVVVVAAAVDLSGVAGTVADIEVVVAAAVGDIFVMDDWSCQSVEYHYSQASRHGVYYLGNQTLDTDELDMAKVPHPAHSRTQSAIPPPSDVMAVLAPGAQTHPSYTCGPQLPRPPIFRSVALLDGCVKSWKQH